MPQAELEGLPLTGVQPGQGCPDEPAQLLPFGAVADIGGWVGEVSRLIEPRVRPPPPAVGIACGPRSKPGTQLSRVPQATKLARGDSERVLDGIGRVVWLGQHPAAVTVKGLPVLVIGVS